METRTWPGKSYIGMICLNAHDFGRDVYTAESWEKKLLGITHRIHNEHTGIFWAIDLDIPGRRIRFMNNDESWGKWQSFRSLHNNNTHQWIWSWEGVYFPENDPTAAC